MEIETDNQIIVQNETIQYKQIYQYNGTKPMDDIEIIDIIANILTEIIQQYDKLPMEYLTNFHGKNIPGISIRDYLLRIHKCSNCAQESFILALIYIDRLTERHKNFLLNSYNIHSIGFGTYQGKPEEEDDIKMFNGLINSIQSGSMNVIDTAINYRYQKSERTIGAALQYLKEKEKLNRENYFLCTKGGFLAEDADQGIPSSIQMNDLIQKKQIKEEDIVGNCHCMHPNYLNYSLEKSLDNLGVETLDIYYLHNPSEVQMPVIGEKAFWKKLSLAFEFLEKMVSQGKIKSYGIATWLAFRSPPNEEKIHLSLQKVLSLAENIGGKNHGFRYIQLPINIMMAESFAERWQKFNNEDLQLLRVARESNINVIVSSPLMGGKLLQSPLPYEVFKCENNASRHLQLIRSIPSTSICSTLIGHKSYKNVQNNLQVAKIPKLTEDEFWDFLIPDDDPDNQQNNK